MRALCQNPKRSRAHLFADAASKGAGVVFEIVQGMVDRGADLRWLSMYPFESEVTFGPLAGLEVQSTRVQGGVLVVEVRLSVNLSEGPIEQVAAATCDLVPILRPPWSRGSCHTSHSGISFDLEAPTEQW